MTSLGISSRQMHPHLVHPIPLRKTNKQRNKNPAQNPPHKTKLCFQRNYISCTADLCHFRRAAPLISQRSTQCSAMTMDNPLRLFSESVVSLQQPSSKAAKSSILRWVTHCHSNQTNGSSHSCSISLLCGV